MARSKVKGTNGKPLKKGKNRDKLKASIHTTTYHDAPHPKSGLGKKGVVKRTFTETTEKNDGKPYRSKQTVIRDSSSGKTKITRGAPKITKDPKAANPIKGKRENARIFTPKRTTTSDAVHTHKSGRKSRHKRNVGGS